MLRLRWGEWGVHMAPLVPGPGLGRQEEGSQWSMRCRFLRGPAGLPAPLLAASPSSRALPQALSHWQGLSQAPPAGRQSPASGKAWAEAPLLGSPRAVGKLTDAMQQTGWQADYAGPGEGDECSGTLGRVEGVWHRPVSKGPVHFTPYDHFPAWAGEVSTGQ